jgi:DNA modification methylase
MFFPPEIRSGDCFEIMAAMPEASVDAIVTDPPYGLEFMGKDWDRFRVDARSARWASRSGAAGDFGVSVIGAVLPSYTRRRTTSQCRTCGKRDAFRNPARVR